MLLDYDFLKKDVVSLLERAADSRPQDADVFVALGVAYNIDRSYGRAAESFITAATLRPEDPTLWNKLGATLANSGLSEASLVAYNQALKLKPNYARAWSNLAIAHCNLNQHQDGIRFYLAALKLSPKAEHLWTLLFNAVAAWAPERDELGDMVDRRDMDSLSAAVGGGVPDVENLPSPERSLPQSVGEVVASLRAQMRRPQNEG
ncbi:Peroxisomal membrane signal receptor PTS1 [Perkinsus olseni]|uniref:Peroxisomal membrane signal receptor PTS1 n=1 Tax=Perkinsus olseni TaxID=32597 RepID=A0A7J6TIB4_PEROL|nr:Peroxisomal membrane signal receptor PTS1 [Perkinsus olseni]